MKYDLVIFDLDGTLMDTLDDLAAAVNHALALRGFPLRKRDEIRRLIGNGVASTMQRAVPQGTPETVWRAALSDFKDYYAQHANVHTRLYDGIPALLDAMKAAGLRSAVNSNKVDAIVQGLCEAYLGGRIDLALGERPEIPKKPAPDGTLAILARLGISPDRALYVGDGETDILTARNAGMDGAWVTWGYRRLDELGSLSVSRAFETVAALGDYILSR